MAEEIDLKEHGQQGGRSEAHCTPTMGRVVEPWGLQKKRGEMRGDKSEDKERPESKSRRRAMCHSNMAGHQDERLTDI